MEATDKTISQIERFFKKIAQKFPDREEPVVMTDIHITASQETGELMAFDDDDVEITRCVVDQYIDNKEPDFYNVIAALLRSELKRCSNVVDNLSILRPYSFVLETDEREHFSELYVVDSDMTIIGGDLMEGLEEDLDNFFNSLFK